MGGLEASLGLDFGSFHIEQFDTPTYGNVIEEKEGEDRTATLRVLGEHGIGERGDLRTALTYGDISHTERLTSSGERDFRQRLWSLGTEVEWRFDDLPGWDGVGATRISVGLSTDGADTPESGGNSRRGRMGDWGGSLGMSTLTGGGSLLLHGGISRRARFPSLRELYSDALGRFLPNPGLEPEVLTGGELGLTWALQGVDIQVVGFRQVLNDGVVRVGVLTPQGPKRQRVNRDGIQSTGLEMVASGEWRAVQYSGDLTLQQAWQMDDNSGDRTRPEYEPGVIGSFALATHLPAGIQGVWRVPVRGERRAVWPERGRGLDGPPEENVTASIFSFGDFSRSRGGPLSRIVDALVSVTNLAGNAIFDQCGLPQPGRTLPDPASALLTRQAGRYFL